ncbi:MAG TPA: hypothetical protein VGI79_11890 [Caulobacteraceae bacterium]
MTSSRRQFASMLIGGVAATGLFAATRVFAQDDDVDSLLNVFISPSGKPFRAPAGAPYPVVAWFKEADKNADGKIDHGEFMADAEAFFKVLDINGDNVLSGYEIAVYERRIAPEILGYQFKASALARPVGRDGGLLWKAQYGSTGMGNMGQGGVPTSVDPAGPPEPSEPKILHDLDETQQGASPFSLFDEPEPVTAADFNFNGLIKKANYLKLADMHFTRLDPDSDGFLTLAKLPKTAVQKKLEHTRRKHR